ncbi:MAG: hypothetical protein LC737_07615 [Chloroflexi bacterium]|nr:hypothetical protein [Chloroflexota bacterium]
MSEKRPDAGQRKRKLAAEVLRGAHLIVRGTMQIAKAIVQYLLHSD